VKRVLFTLGAALLVVVPAATGLIGNTSFAQSVPVRVPSHAIIVDYHGAQRPASTSEPRDDHGGQHPAGTTAPRDDSSHRSAATAGSGQARVSGDDSGKATVSGSKPSTADSKPGTADKGRHGQKASGGGSGTDGPGHT
jgi:hypothetical protein